MECAGYFVPWSLSGGQLGLLEQRFELGKDPLDRVQVKRIGWQEAQGCGTRRDGLTHVGNLVTAGVVDDDDVPWHSVGAGNCSM